MFLLRHAFIPNFGAKDNVKRIFLVFHVTAGIVFIQLVLGGLFTFDYATYQEHLFTGVLVGIMSIVSLITALFLAKPRSNSLVIPTVFMLALIALQGALGLSISHVPWLVMVHYTNALIIFALSIVTVLNTVRLSKMPEPAITASASSTRQ